MGAGDAPSGLETRPSVEPNYGTTATDRNVSRMLRRVGSLVKASHGDAPPPAEPLLPNKNTFNASYFLRNRISLPCGGDAFSRSSRPLFKTCPKHLFEPAAQPIRPLWWAGAHAPGAPGWSVIAASRSRATLLPRQLFAFCASRN